MINKHQFNISNTKKVLHKVGKQWVTVSVALLAMIGIGAAASSAGHSVANPTHIVASAATVSNKAEYEDGTTPVSIKNISGIKGHSAKGAIDANMPNGYAPKYNSDHKNFKNNGDPLYVNVVRARVMNRVEYEDGEASPSVASVARIHGIQGKSAKSAIDAHVPNGYAVKYHTDHKNFKPNDGALYVNVIRARNTNRIEYEDGTRLISYHDATGLKGNSAKSAIDANIPNGYAIKYHSDHKNFKNNGDRLYVNVILSRNMNRIEYEDGASLIGYYDATGLKGKSAKSIIDSHIPNGYAVKYSSDRKNFGNNDARLYVNVIRARNMNKIEYEDGNNFVSSVNANGIAGASAKGVIDAHIPSGYMVTDGSDAKDFLNGNGDALEVNVTRKHTIPKSNHVANNIEYEDGDQIVGHLMANGTKGHSAKGVIDDYLPEGYRIVGNTDNKVFKDNLDALEVTVAKTRPRRTHFYFGLVRFGRHARKNLTIRLTKGLIEYNTPNFSNDAEVRPLHKGLVLPVKAIYRARNHDVRFQLPNGKFITAIKSYSVLTNRRALRKNKRVRRIRRNYVPQIVKNMFAGHRSVRIRVGRRNMYVSAKRMNTVKVLRTRRHGRHMTYYVKVGRKYGRVYGRYYH